MAMYIFVIHGLFHFISFVVGYTSKASSRGSGGGHPMGSYASTSARASGFVGQGLEPSAAGEEGQRPPYESSDGGHGPGVASG